jgi:N-acyl-D-aspartate/D-glutamate deacylase
MLDLLIRGGLVVDGTGAAPRVADVAVSGGRIAGVAPDIEGPAGEEIDGRGLIVTPGFVDIHTHYDGQITWDPLLAPSSAHGVTTVLNGNCGVGFAPVRPGREPWLVQLMEGVEDIPAESLREGIDWGWETFSEYLDALESRRWAVDVATLVPHGAVRAYVMGDRGARCEPESDTDRRSIANVVREAIEAGAFGFSTSRVEGHRASDGLPVPGTYAERDELDAIATAVAAAGGFMEVAQAGISGGDGDQFKELGLMAELSRCHGVPLSFIVMQNRRFPSHWRGLLDAIAAENDSGASVVAQVAARPFGMLVGFNGYHPFVARPTYRQLVRSLSREELLDRLRQSDVREAILAEVDDTAGLPVADVRMIGTITANVDNLFQFGDDVDYEPGPDRAVAALSRQREQDPLRTIYDLSCDNGGNGFLLLPMFNYADGDHSVLREMLLAPHTIVGLGDGGAHCRMICDASQPTSVLTHWVRDRQRGPRLDLPLAVRRLTSEPSAFLGLHDRGTVQVGLRADLNVIDLDRLEVQPPRAVDDLPAGGRRILQDATGYVATVVAGQVTRRHGQPTGALPGRLLRRTR